MAIDPPGTGKLPNQPMFLEKLDPKIERVLKYQWEEIARYVNKIAASVPYQSENNNTVEISSGGVRGYLPIGTDYNNFNDGNFWRLSDDVIFDYSLNNNKVTFNYNANQNHFGGSGPGGLLFVPMLYPDTNGDIAVRMRLDNLNWVGNTAATWAFWALGMIPGNQYLTSQAAQMLGLGRYVSGNNNNMYIFSVNHSNWQLATFGLAVTHGNNYPVDNSLHSGDLKFEVNINNLTQNNSIYKGSMHAKPIADANYYNMSALFGLGFNYVFLTYQVFYPGIQFFMRGFVNNNFTTFSGEVTQFEVLKGRVYL